MSISLLRLTALGCLLLLGSQAVAADIQPDDDEPRAQQAELGELAPVSQVVVTRRSVLLVGNTQQPPAAVVIWLHAAGVSVGTEAEWWSRAPITSQDVVVACPAADGNAWLERRDAGHIRATIRQLSMQWPTAQILVAGSGGGAHLGARLTLNHRLAVDTLVCFDGLPSPPYPDARPESPPLYIFRGRNDPNLSRSLVNERTRALTKKGYQVTTRVEERGRTLDADAWTSIEQLIRANQITASPAENPPD